MGPYLDQQGWAAPAQPLQGGSKGAGLREVLKKALPVLPGQGRDIPWGMEHPRDPQPCEGGWEMAVGRASPFPRPSVTPRSLDHHGGIPRWSDETGGRGSERLRPELQPQGGRHCHHWHRHLGDRVQPGEPRLPHGEPGRAGQGSAVPVPGLPGGSCQGLWWEQVLLDVTVAGNPGKPSCTRSDGHRSLEWFGLEGTQRFTLFHPLPWAGNISLDQAAPRTTQVGLEPFQGWSQAGIC